MDPAALSGRSRVFVGLPAYNEEEALPQLLDDLEGVLVRAVERGELRESVQASNAVQAVNGRIFCGKPLDVARAQHKDGEGWDTG